MIFRGTKIFATMCMLFIASGIFLTTPASAEGLLCCTCKDEVSESLEKNWYSNNSSTVRKMVSRFEGEFTGQKLFIAGLVWEDNVLPAMMLLTEQLSALAMQQMQIIGTFFDAKIQIETQQLFQIEQAHIRKSYQPSQGMCEFGSSVKSLAASERKGEVTALMMAQRAQDRDLANAKTLSYGGPSSDKESRIKQFKDSFCNLEDNNNGLGVLCENGGAAPKRLNKDIDYVRAVDEPWTLNVDFTDKTITDDEKEILALSAVLYGHDVAPRIPSQSLADGDDTITSIHEKYMDVRAMTAKRSVARNSLNAQLAMKSEGTAGSREFLVNILRDLGVDSQQSIDHMLSGNNTSEGALNNVAPSYNAQMEVLTKKLYQNPDFYTGLYETPANVNRKKVALQAIGLMQKFDIFESYLRHEASASVLLELAVAKMQDEIENAPD